MNYSRIASRILPGLFFVSVLGGASVATPAQAQKEVKPCYVKAAVEGGTVLTIVSGDGSTATYGPNQDELAKAEDIINSNGLGPCEELPAPSIPFDSSGLGIAAATIAAFGIAAKRKKTSTEAN